MKRERHPHTEPGGPERKLQSPLRNMLPGTGIIALTLLSGNSYRQAAIVIGAEDLVRKET
jgi:hypothetical protein